MSINTFQKSAPATPAQKLEAYEVKEMMIIKQAILKSLIEAGAVKECTPEAKGLVYKWASFIYLNSYEEWKVAHPGAHANPESVPFN